MKVYNRNESNKFPKCFSMEIDAAPVNNLFYWNKRKYQLCISFCFSDKHEEYLEGYTVQIGLTGGDLNLKLTRSEMSLANVAMGKLIDLETIIKEEIKSESGRESNVSISVKPSATTKINQKTVIDEQYTSTNSIVRLASYSSPTDMAWVFESSRILKGHCKKEKLGIIELIGCPCYVDVTFTIPKKHIDVVMIKDPSGEEINRSLWNNNRYKVFKAKVVKKIGVGTPDFHISKVKLEKDR